MKDIKRILIVNDNTEFRELLAQAARNSKQIVTTASGVKDAENILAQQEFSLVCSDINMADGSGFDLLDYIQKKYSTLPVILMSSNLTEQDRFRARLSKTLCLEKTESGFLDTIIHYGR